MVENDKDMQIFQISRIGLGLRRWVTKNGAK